MTRQPCSTRSHTALRSPRALCMAGRLTLCCVHVRRRCAACRAACLPVKLAVTRARQVLPLPALLLLLLQLRGYTLSLCLFVCSGFISFFVLFCKLIDFFSSFILLWFMCVCVYARSLIRSLSLSLCNVSTRQSSACCCCCCGYYCLLLLAVRLFFPSNIESRFR